MHDLNSIKQSLRSTVSSVVSEDYEKNGNVQIGTSENNNNNENLEIGDSTEIETINDDQKACLDSAKNYCDINAHEEIDQMQVKIK